jgi:CBS-domain-containing membrane protein
MDCEHASETVGKAGFQPVSIGAACLGRVRVVAGAMPGIAITAFAWHAPAEPTAQWQWPIAPMGAPAGDRVGGIMTRPVRVASAHRHRIHLIALFGSSGHHPIPIEATDRHVGIVTHTDVAAALIRIDAPTGRSDASDGRCRTSPI